MSPNSERYPSIMRLRLAFRDAGKRRRFGAVAIAVALCYAAFIGFGAVSGTAGLNGYEVGKVADRDIVAERDIVYVDAKATRIRVDAERRLVPAVFSIDDSVGKSAVEAIIAFRKGFLDLASGTKTGDELALRLRGRFPDLGASDLPGRLADYPAPGNAIEQARFVLEALMHRGVFAIPDSGLEDYNPESIELRRWTDGPLVYEQVPIEKATTQRRVKAAANELAKSLKLSATMTTLAADTAAAFTHENAFFDSEQSRRRLEAAVSRVDPVMRKIAKGDKVIRQGFIVTAEDIERLAAMRGPGSRLDALYMLGGLIMLVILSVGAVSILGRADTGIKPEGPTFPFVVVMAAGDFVFASALQAFLPATMDAQFEAFLPMALLSMLAAILVGERFALLFTVLLSASLLLVTGFDAFAPAQATLSGIAGIVLVRRAEKRIDLVRAGTQLALVRFIFGFALAALADRGFIGSFGTGFWSAINGFMCGVLALAFLPVLEQALNVPTVFRLQELSDLNAPALKQLLSVAPGTYSHSVTVAHLAESACREIGADALLARVGAYYHDIGKIEKPEYFIENQSGYNKHDDINPRLSATVLRGHVKFGLERADALRLPDSVKAIIAEHHGTTLISYFYAQAQKEERDTSSEDYRYPGPLPSSREAAVVMLADCVEAASRTLKRPTVSKLDQFVKEMVMGRYETGQLVKSKLTFSDLELIKNSFSRILAGHFHSRIEYPKTREQA
ncbi:MAG: phosphohydrolase [Spirochaetae bacterium HGW-Spirochaetae-7]|nr:MAG: phosphohydrolase [Spirochaetae bacterium HGW-Spirochaetae-7]